MYQYVLFTAARNEEKFISKTIEGVLAQTILPLKWIIVSDASEDRTDKIISLYTEKYSFIELLRIEKSGQRNFASKVYAMRAGYSWLSNFPYDFIGNIDADIFLPQDYFEKIINHFQKDKKIGVAGGIISEKINEKMIDQLISRDSVAGAVQLFRRSCFEDIGDFNPQIYGGEDAEVEIKARMKGWIVKTIPQIKAIHMRPGNINKKQLLIRRHNQGRMFYQLGYHPVFFVTRAIFKMRERPFFLGSFFQLIGYLKAFILKDKVTISSEVLKYLRMEQIEKLKQKFRKSAFLQP